MVNLGKCKNKEDLIKELSETQGYQPTIANKTEPPRGTVKTKKCTIYFKNKSSFEITKLKDIDFKDKDFIIFTEYGGNVKIYRRDELLEIHIDEPTLNQTRKEYGLPEINQK